MGSAYQTIPSQRLVALADRWCFWSNVCFRLWKRAFFIGDQGHSKSFSIIFLIFHKKSPKTNCCRMEFGRYIFSVQFDRRLRHASFRASVVHRQPSIDPSNKEKRSHLHPTILKPTNRDHSPLPNTSNDKFDFPYCRWLHWCNKFQQSILHPG